MADPDIDLSMPQPGRRPPPVAPSYSTPNVYASAPPPPVFKPMYSVATGLSSSAARPTETKPPLSAHARKTLASQGYTDGLIDAIEQNRQAFAHSFWIIDNSGSMATRDGQRIVGNTNKSQIKFTESTRWAELQQTVDYHMQLAHLLQAPTTFRLLNDPGRLAGPAECSLVEFSDAELAVATNTILNTQPGGVTPLTRHVIEISAQIRALPLAPGEKVCIVLATDGTPTNERGYASKHIEQEFVQALGSLSDLPVWLVVRLCTDEEAVVRFWNNLDQQLELELEVLDDFVAEAAEVYEQNPFINYGLPMHRMREMGFYHKVMDRLDESKLSTDDLRDFLRIVVGRQVMRAPDPGDNFKSFSNAIDGMIRKIPKTWNPVTKKVAPWIDVKAMNKAYGAGGWFW